MSDSVELYKKYRPKTWRNFIGQGRVIKSLQDMVMKNSIPSAMLFSGPRGCGKTSTAFVLAKALNCDNLQDDGSPCNKCQSCVAIDSNSSYGVHYLSMANASGVDSVRKIVDEARLNQGAKKTVYIIDEVHNSSPAAFDSLLIPLEENLPAFFILCTTEPHKVPATITSRIQQRRFSLVPRTVMKKYITKLVEHEGLDVNEDVIDKAVRAGRGSVRDTLTQLETIIQTGGDDVSYLEDYFEGLANKRLEQCLLAINSATSAGVPGGILISECYESLKSMFLFESGMTSEYIPVPGEEMKKFYGRKGLDLLFREMSDCAIDSARGIDPILAIETVTVRMITLLQKIEKSQRARN